MRCSAYVAAGTQNHTLQILCIDLHSVSGREIRSLAATGPRHLACAKQGTPAALNVHFLRQAPRLMLLHDKWLCTEQLQRMVKQGGCVLMREAGAPQPAVRLAAVDSPAARAGASACAAQSRGVWPWTCRSEQRRRQGARSLHGAVPCCAPEHLRCVPALLSSANTGVALRSDGPTRRLCAMHTTS